MKKLIIFVFLCRGLFLLWQSWMTCSETIALEGSGYELTYSMVWGMSMHERLSLAKAGHPFSTVSSDWVELYKKPYNAGLAVYRRLDGSVYYFGFLYHTVRFEPASGAMQVVCESKPDDVAYTGAGARFAQMKNLIRSWQADAGAPRLFEYIDERLLGTSSGPPTASKYYASLQYLGRFGVLKGDREKDLRGTGVGFLPAATPEPHLVLNVHCG